jgi:hypothetical protein
MNKLLARWVVPFAAMSAFAQTPEAPVERVGGVTVAIFVVLFFGMCAGIVWLSVVGGRKEKREQEALARKSGGNS